MTSLQHPSHDHLLNLHDSRENGAFSRCYLCCCVIDNDTFYSCEECKVCLHKRCAEAPSEIQRHPLHSQHPLTLIPQQSDAFRCDVCLVQHDSASTFKCKQCDFNLDMDCALCTLLDSEDNSVAKREEFKTVQHPYHDHLLTSFSVKWKLPISCRACKEEIEGEVYCCIECKFFLHNKCLEWPYKIRHPLHRSHSLRYTSGYFHECFVCDSSGPFEAGYSCLDCRFQMDLRCAINVDLVKEGKETKDGTRIQCVAHEHELVRLCVKAETFIGCRICGSSIIGEFLGCTDCWFFFHGKCIKAPQLLQNPRHPAHSMTLYIDTRLYGQCSSCSASSKCQIVYRCECGLTVHTECALQTLIYYEEGADLEIKLPWHKHPFYLCHRTNWSGEYCDGCGDDVKGLGYYCAECELLLHKSCSELTTEIEHPHHPRHLLHLVPESSMQLYDCNACREKIVGFRFSCDKCEFYLDTKCASEVPTRKHELHEHKLACFQTNRSSPCNVCGNNDGSALLRCVPCNFNLHPDCSKLPQTVKLKSHWHSLTLYESYVEDDSGEYYCDICEKTRNPNLGTYICEECKKKGGYIAHIECALPLMNLKKGKNSTLTKVDERIANLEKKVLATKKKLKALEEELEEARRERDHSVV